MDFSLSSLSFNGQDLLALLSALKTDSISKWFGDIGAVFDLKSFMKYKVNTNDLDKKES